METSGLLNYDLTKKLILAGKSILTFQSESGNRFTYKIVKCKKDEKLFFVSVLCGPDNTRNYKYFGVILDKNNKKEFKFGFKSRLQKDTQSVKAFQWVFSHLFSNTLNRVKIYNSGHCCRCGRLLTTPESIMRGIGPECIKFI